MGDAASFGGVAPAPDAAVQHKLLPSVTRVLSESDRDFLDMDVEAADLELAIKHM